MTADVKLFQVRYETGIFDTTNFIVEASTEKGGLMKGRLEASRADISERNFLDIRELVPVERLAHERTVELLEDEIRGLKGMLNDVQSAMQGFKGYGE